MSSELLQTYERGQSTIRVAISAEAIYDSDFLSVVTTPEWTPTLPKYTSSSLYFHLAYT